MGMGVVFSVTGKVTSPIRAASISVTGITANSSSVGPPSSKTSASKAGCRIVCEMSCLWTMASAPTAYGTLFSCERPKSRKRQWHLPGR